jgi:hypothetical protein
VLPRSTFTINLVFVIGCHCFCPPPRNPAQNATVFSENHCSTTQLGRLEKKLKEVLGTHGHRNSPVHDPEFSSFVKPTPNRSSKVTGIPATANQCTLMTVEWKSVSHGNPRQADSSLCIFHPISPSSLMLLISYDSRPL